MERYTYWLILICSVAGPLLLSFDKKVAFYKSWKHLFPAAIVMAAFFIFWDHYFTKFGVWGFNENYITGIWIFGLPVEEISFFIVIPFCCLFIYEVLNAYVKKDILLPLEKFISYGLILLFMYLAYRNPGKAYTFYTNFFSATFLIILKLLKVRFLSRFYLSYIVSSIPFLIVNGFLTAIPVVVYNDAENLGIRIYTIPADDLVYSFLMLSMTTAFYEFFRKRAENNPAHKISGQPA